MLPACPQERLWREPLLLLSGARVLGVAFEISAIARTFRIGVGTLILNFMTIFPSLAMRYSSSAPAHPTHLSPLVLRPPSPAPRPAPPGTGNGCRSPPRRNLPPFPPVHSWSQLQCLAWPVYLMPACWSLPHPVPSWAAPACTPSFPPSLHPGPQHAACCTAKDHSKLVRGLSSCITFGGRCGWC